MLYPASAFLQHPEHHTRAWPLQGLLLRAIALMLPESLEAPAQVSEVCCVKNQVLLLLVCHDMNRLLARTGRGISRWSAALGLWVSSSCDHWAALSPPVLLRSTFSTLHPCLG